MTKEIWIQLDEQPYDNGDGEMLLARDTIPAALAQLGYDAAADEFRLVLKDDGTQWLVTNDAECAIYALRWASGDL